MKKFEWYGFQETFNIILNEVINNKKSFLRLGDGDFRIICGHNCTVNYQIMDINLKNDLNDLLNNKNKNLLICLPKLLKKNWLNE